MTTLTGSAYLFGRGSIAPIPRLTIPAEGSLTGTGTVEANADVYAAMMAGAGSLTANEQMTMPTAVVLGGAGTLTASAVRISSGSTSLLATGTLAARASVRVSRNSVAELLPPHSTLFERSMAAAVSYKVPVEIRAVVSPPQTPDNFLPFLAGHESVDLWFDDWSDARKREMTAEAPTIAWLKGTRQGSIRFLHYVDGTLVDAIAYPARFVMGRGKIGRTPIGHAPWVARYLVRIETLRPPRSFVLGRSTCSVDRLKTHSRERLRRGLVALRTAKAPETEYRVDYAHKRMIRLSDGISLDGSQRLGGYLTRIKL
jgi:P2-related tail formation protein